MKKNLLMLVADQHRADALGCAGKYNIKTPNLDALAADGVRFSNAFTPLPVCAPARQSMLCGLNPDSYGAFWNFGFFDAASLSPSGYWPEKLHDAGYRTAFLGKWSASEKHGAAEFGYDEYIGTGEYGKLRREKYPNAKRGDWFGWKSDIPLDDSETHWLAARAGEKIAEFAASGEPWHIRVDYSVPHLPNEVSEPFASMYDKEEIVPWPGVGDTFEGKPYIQKQQTMSWGLDEMSWEDWVPVVRRYYGMVSQLDDSIGRIIAALKAAGQYENTVIIYTSDHGDTCGDHGMIDKHYILFDDVVKIPYIVVCPEMRRGAVEPAFISGGLDLPPTMDELFGISSPKAQGRSIVPLLRGETPQDWRKEINASSNGQQFGMFNQRMLRGERYKYIWNMTDIDEFYDLEEDPGEKHNLIYADEHRQRISEMRRRLYTLLKEQKDLFIQSGWLDRQLLNDKKH